MHILIAELFPTEIRTQSIGITESITLASGALAIKLFPNFKEAFGVFGICCLFSVFALILIIWGAFTIPDNRGKSLVKVEEMYEEGNNKDKTRITPWIMDKDTIKEKLAFCLLALKNNCFK